MAEKAQLTSPSASALTELLPAVRLRELYVSALRMRLTLDEKIAMKLRGQHEIGGFFIGGMGEEVHGAATAQAVWDALGLEVGACVESRRCEDITDEPADASMENICKPARHETRAGPVDAAAPVVNAFPAAAAVQAR